MAVYVGDIILGEKSETKMNAVKEELSQRFKMYDLGPIHHFLGIKVIQDQLTGLVNLKRSSISLVCTTPNCQLTCQS